MKKTERKDKKSGSGTFNKEEIIKNIAELRALLAKKDKD